MSVDDGSKNILYIYHRLDIIGGIETRWINEFQYLEKHNFNFFFAAPLHRVKSNIVSLLDIKNLIGMDLGAYTDLERAPHFINLVNYFISIINNKNIQVLSIHMLNTFSWAAVIAAQICKVPTIATNHGITNIYNQPMKKFFVESFIEKSFSLSVSISDALTNIGPSSKNTAVTIPNLIDLNRFKHYDNTDNSKWLIVSRLSKEKFEGILSFLKAASFCNIKEVDIAGGGDPSPLKASIKAMNVPIKVTFLGEVKDIELLMPKYSGISGVGRVALEGLACRKPVCIISISGDIVGLINSENFDDLKRFNFTGKGVPTISINQLSEQLNQLNTLDVDKTYNLLERDLSTVEWDRYIELYKGVRFTDNKPLQALYYKTTYYCNVMSKPYLQDKFFKYLLIETLIEYKMDDELKLLDFYEARYGLFKDYPSPFKVSNNKRAPEYLAKVVNKLRNKLS